MRSDELKYLKDHPSAGQIVDLLSDIKHRVFPRPFERLAVTGRDLVGAEIGVYKAEHALSLLTNLSIKRLYLIDPYEMYESYAEGHRHYGTDQAPLSVAEVEARERLRPYEDKIVWLKDFSDRAAPRIQEELDFVYVDGNHEESFVATDINAYIGLIKKGGVMGGHDFYNGFQREHDGVVQAVAKYAVAHDLPLQVELPDWWFTV